MNITSVFPFIKKTADSPRQITSSSWSEHKSILEREVNLFVWERPMELATSHYLEHLTTHDLPAIRYFVDRENIHDQLEKARFLWEPSTNNQGNEFWLDIQYVVSDFLHLSKNKSGVLHLRIVDNDACTKFHIDGYDLRLFATYYGLGTEWLPEEALSRSALGSTNELIVKDETKIRRVGTGHIAILKGELPNRRNPVKGIVHRSPKISHSGEKRIILRVDI